jgi:hypothetical protein
LKSASHFDPLLAAGRSWVGLHVFRQAARDFQKVFVTELSQDRISKLAERPSSPMKLSK